MKRARYEQPKKKKKRRRLAATIAFITAVVACAAVICLLMFFNISDITASGLVRYTTQEIVDASGIQIGQNIFAIDSKKVQQRIKERFPYVDQVRLHRYLPTSVELEVVETQAAVAVVGAPDRYTLLSKSDRIVEQVQDVSTEGLPLVVGTDFTQLPVGFEATQEALDALEKQARDNQKKKLDPPPLLEETRQALDVMVMVHYVLDAAKQTGFEGIRYIDVSDPLCLTVLYEDRVLIKLGTELELPYKLKFAATVLEESGDYFSGTVDVSLSATNQRAYSREEDIMPLLQEDYLEGYY